MTVKGKALTQVLYTQDDGSEAHAIVLDHDQNNDTYNLAVIDPDTYALHAANGVTTDRVK